MKIIYTLFDIDSQKFFEFTYLRDELSLFDFGSILRVLDAMYLNLTKNALMVLPPFDQRNSVFSYSALAAKIASHKKDFERVMLVNFGTSDKTLKYMKNQLLDNGSVLFASLSTQEALRSTVDKNGYFINFSLTNVILYYCPIVTLLYLKFLYNLSKLYQIQIYSHFFKEY